MERLKPSLWKLYGRYGNLNQQYKVPISRMLKDILTLDSIQWHPPLNRLTGTHNCDTKRGLCRYTRCVFGIFATDIAYEPGILSLLRIVLSCLGLTCALLVDTIYNQNCRTFPGFSLSIFLFIVSVLLLNENIFSDYYSFYIQIGPVIFSCVNLEYLKKIRTSYRIML